MPDSRIEKLDPRVRDHAVQLINTALEQGIHLAIICTLRSEEEQRKALLSGNSWTMASKHLPQPPDGLALAIDVCPVQLLSKKNWDPTNELWWKLGHIGIQLGLRWGGDWQGVGIGSVGRPRPKWDPGHFEWTPKTPPLGAKQLELFT